jgi:hypothetical protein
MTNVIPLVTKFGKNEMKRAYAGPRPETLSMICVFARIYETNPSEDSRYRNFRFN